MWGPFHFQTNHTENEAVSFLMTHGRMATDADLVSLIALRQVTQSRSFSIFWRSGESVGGEGGQTLSILLFSQRIEIFFYDEATGGLNFPQDQVKNVCMYVSIYLAIVEVGQYGKSRDQKVEVSCPGSFFVVVPTVSTCCCNPHNLCPGINITAIVAVLTIKNCKSKFHRQSDI